MGTPTICYLAGSRLFLKRPDEEPIELQSQFAEEVRDRAVKMKKRHEWKQQGRGAQFGGALLWGMDADVDTGLGPMARITSVTAGRREGEVLYALSSGRVSGVFAADATAEDPSDTETRLFHTADFQVRHLSRGRDHEWIACAVTSAQGLEHVAVLHEDGADFEQLTEGDSLDAAPSWIPGVHAQLVYQSAGVGRDPEGLVVGLGPFRVERLDVPTSEIETLLSDAQTDFLGPRMDADGRLYCIRRPWKDPSAGPLRSPKTVGRAFLDFVLFPFRVLFAVFGWLNFFTTRYTGKPLTTAGGPEKQGQDARQMLIWGNLIDANQAAQSGERFGDGPPSLVPGTWRLVRTGPDAEGEPEVLAKGVVAFDLAPDGAVVFSNGNAVYRLAEGSRPEKLVAAEAITQVAIVYQA